MLLEVKDLNISLTSEKSVAEHISFRLGQGEMLSIVGSSGAGKTTICKAIMGLLGNTYRADDEILWECLIMNSDPDSDGEDDYAFDPDKVAEYRKKRRSFSQQ